MLKNIANIFSWVILLGGIFALVGFVNKKQQKQSLKDLIIHIEQPTNSRFVTQKEIKSLFSNLGYQYENQSITEVDIHQLEILLKNNSSIESAQVYYSIDGMLKIDIKERTPIVRIFNKQNESFYLDRFGSLMPLSNKYAARVLIVNGNINIPFATVYQMEHLEGKLDKIFRKKNTSAIENTYLLKKLNKDKTNLEGAKQLSALFDLSNYIYQNKFWNAQISQVYINDEKDIEMIPRVGNHIIILGNAKDFETKLEKLMIFYKKGLNNTGWNNYSTINLKYKNQVVCTKQ